MEILCPTTGITYPTSKNSDQFLGTTSGPGAMWIGAERMGEIIWESNLPKHLKFVVNTKRDEKPAVTMFAMPFQRINDTYAYATNGIAQVKHVRSFFLADKGVKFDQNAWSKVSRLRAVNFGPKSGGVIRIDYSSQFEFSHLNLVHNVGGFAPAIDHNPFGNSTRIVGTPKEPSRIEGMYAAMVAPPGGGEIMLKNVEVIGGGHAMTIEPKGNKRFFYDKRDGAFKPNPGYQRVLIENLITPSDEKGRNADIRIQNIKLIRSKAFSPGMFGTYPTIKVIRNGKLFRAYATESLPNRVPFPLDEEFTGVPDIFRGKTNLQLYQEFGRGFGGYIPPSVSEDSQVPGISGYIPPGNDWHALSASQSDIPNFKLRLIRDYDRKVFEQDFVLQPGWNVLTTNFEGERNMSIIWHRTQPYKLIECTGCPYRGSYGKGGYVTSKFTRVMFAFDNGNGRGGFKKDFRWSREEREQFPVVGAHRIYPLYFQFDGDTQLSYMEVPLPTANEN